MSCFPHGRTQDRQGLSGRAIHLCEADGTIKGLKVLVILPPESHLLCCGCGDDRRRRQGGFRDRLQGDESQKETGETARIWTNLSAPMRIAVPATFSTF
jgi:hypothetical protein